VVLDRESVDGELAAGRPEVEVTQDEHSDWGVGSTTYRSIPHRSPAITKKVRLTLRSTQWFVLRANTPNPATG
jgi:hypothetical protein